MDDLDVLVPAGGRLAVGSLHASLASADEEDVVFDLRQAAWVEPIGLVMLAALSERAQREARVVRLLAPQDVHVARYLSRMRLGAVLEELGHSHDLPAVNAWDRGSDLLELRRFQGTAEPDELGRMLFDRTRDNLQLAKALHQSVAETCVNVPDHARRSWGYVAAQTTYGGSVVHFAVGDAGDGVAAGFAPQESLDDAEALRQVLELGRSRLGVGHGRGVTRTKDIVTGMGGSLHMISGTASRTVTRRGSVAAQATAAYGGTLLQGSFAVPAAVHNPSPGR